MATKIEREIVAVRLQNGALDDKDKDTIVAHGWLDLAALLELRVGDYQREVLETHKSKKSKLYAAIERGERIPDITLGMRGQRFTTRAGTFYLEDDVFIIDGLQRVSNLRKFAVQYPDRVSEIRIGAEVRFNTTRETEKALFTAMNLNRTAMSPNVILRNAREDSTGLLTLYGLSHNDPSFVLYNRVCWNQKMSRNELLTALNYCKSILALHRTVSQSGPTTSVALVPPQLQRIGDDIGIQHLRDNAYRFYETVDEIWGIKGIKYVDINTHLRSNFLNILARLFASHDNFWDDKKLIVDARARQKLKAFPLDDPQIMKLAGAGNNASDLLYRLLVDHMDKGQKIHKLIPREIPDYRKGKYAVKAQARRRETMAKEMAKEKAKTVARAAAK